MDINTGGLQSLAAMMAGGGSMAQRVLTALSDPNRDPIKNPTVNALRPCAPTVNATLRYDEWKTFDDAVIGTARQRLRAVADLQAAGLVYNFDGLAASVLQTEKVTDMAAAKLTMVPDADMEDDAIEFDPAYLPLPVALKSFKLPIRTLNQGRKQGLPISTLAAEAASFQVATTLEKLLVNGSSGITFGGGTVYGYLDFPSRNTVSLTQNWDASGKTAAEILADVHSLRAANVAANHGGSSVLYVPQAWDKPLQYDYVTSAVTQVSSRTVRQRILDIDGIDDVRVLDVMTANKAALVEMSSQTVRLANGLAPTMIEWQAKGGLVSHFAVMSIMVPDLRADHDGNCGIAVLSA